MYGYTTFGLSIQQVTDIGVVSLMADDVEHFFMCSLVILILKLLFFEKCVVTFVAHFKI